MSFNKNFYQVEYDTPVVDVTGPPYGATGNGTTDDTAAIQAAIDAAYVQADTWGQAAIYLPPGQYRCNTGLTWKKDVAILGAGPETALIPYGTLPFLANDAKMGLLTATGSYQTSRQVLAANFAVNLRQADGDGYAFNLDYGVLFKDFVNLLFVGGVNLKLRGAYKFVQLNGSTLNENYHNRIIGNQFHGLYAPTGAIYNEYVRANNTLIYSNHNLVDSCRWYGCGTNVNMPGQWNVFTNNVFNPPSYNEINMVDGFAAGGVDCHIFLPYADQVQFGHGNYFEDAALDNDPPFLIYSNMTGTNSGAGVRFAAPPQGGMDWASYTTDHRIVVWGDIYGPASEFETAHAWELTRIDESTIDIEDGDELFAKFYAAYYYGKHVWIKGAGGWYSSDITSVTDTGDDLRIVVTQANVPLNPTHIAYEATAGCYWPTGDFGEGIAGPTMPIRFTINATTPSVRIANWYHKPIFKTNNSGSTKTITNFTDGVAGNSFILLIGDAYTAIDFTGTNLKGNGGADWSPTSGDWMECYFDGTDWYCSCHDCTA